MEAIMSEIKKYPASFIMLSYNQKDCVDIAVHAALNQQCIPLEIIFSDDASTDGTFDIIKNIVSNYTGPHYVKAIQNNHNLGINLHLERLVEIAKSDLIIWAAGDDVSFPNRANQIIKAHNSSGAKLIFSDAITHTSKGTKGSDIHKSALFYGSYNLRQTAVSFALYLGATLATHKSLFKSYDKLPKNGVYEDLILGFRANHENSIYYIDMPLISYLEDEGITGTNAIKKNRRQILLMQIKTIEQRIIDAKKFGLSHKDPIIKILKKNQNWYKSRLNFYSKYYGISFSFMYSPIRSIHALLAEALRAKKNRHL